MSPQDLFAVEVFDGRIACIRVSTEQDRHMGPQWVEGFERALERVGASNALHSAVLVGGEHSFSAGASREVLLARGGGSTPAQYAARAARAVLDLPIPVVAALEGHAVGGGLLLGLWSDTLVLAEESLYGANFISLGLTPGMGATWAMLEAFGATLGRELLLTGRLVKGRSIQAAGCPLSHAVRPRDQVRTVALDLAAEMADAPRAALVRLKRTLALPRRKALEHALAAESADQAAILADPRTFAEISERYPSS